jgi:hypothetical protein
MSYIKKKKQLLAQLDALRILGKRSLVRELRRQIQDELKALEINKHKLRRSLSTLRSAQKKENTKLNRSNAARKHHHYIRLIHDNFPGLSYLEIRRQLARRKKGLDVSIPDVIWQNPSP